MLNSSSLISGHGFYWKTVKGLYIVPGRAVHEGVMKDTLVLNETIVREDYWTWTAEGQVQWSKGRKEKTKKERMKEEELCQVKWPLRPPSHAHHACARTTFKPIIKITITATTTHTKIKHNFLQLPI